MNIEKLRSSPLINEKILEDNISSFNFNRKTFRKKEWNDTTIKARGLFINTETGRVKARSYDKFFNIGEREDTQLEIIANTFNYPVEAYIKENGYLGICSWNEDGSLFCASKSTTQGDYARRFKEILYDTLGDKVEKFSRKLQKENLSAVFEVIDPEYDTHIIEYHETKVILLDLIYNEWEEGDLDFLNKNYEILEVWGKIFGLEIKKRTHKLFNKEQLIDFYNTVTAVGYKYNDQYIEGFVLEDIDMRHVKIKTDFYAYWKCLRGAIPASRKGKMWNYSKTDIKKHPHVWNVLAIITRIAPQYYENHGKDIDIITIRKIYENDLCN